MQVLSGLVVSVSREDHEKTPGSASWQEEGTRDNDYFKPAHNYKVSVCIHMELSVLASVVPRLRQSLMWGMTIDGLHENDIGGENTRLVV